MTSNLFDSQGRQKSLVQPRRDSAATTGWVRALYVLAILSVVIPVRSSGWVTLAMGGQWSSPFGLAWLGIVALAIWRIAVVVRDARRLEAPIGLAPQRWCKALGIALMGIGTLGSTLQFFVGPIGTTLFPRGSGSGVEFFAIGLWLAISTALAPIGFVLFEASRLLSFERWYREQR